MNETKRPKPNYLWSILTMRCPRCRRGKMFNHPNPFKRLTTKHIFDMPDNCPVCQQKYDLETGFWYGTGYVSYALTVAVSVTTFVAGMVLFGISFSNNSIFIWLGINIAVLVILQPWIMRLSRVIYLYFFVSYDPEYDKHKPVEFD